MRHAAAACLFCAVGMLAAALPAPARADTVDLKDGTRVTGTLRRNGTGGWIVYTPGGGVVPVPAEAVLSVELAPSSALTPQQLDDRLQGLRQWADTRTLNNDWQLEAVIIRYQQFIVHLPPSPTRTAAQQDLKTWQERYRRRMVRIGQRWFDPATEAAAISDAASAQAEQARQLIKQRDLDAATPLLVQAVGADPANVASLYLLALVRFEQNDVDASRSALNALLPLEQNHAPSLNNLAVVQWRQNQFMAALSSYETAMKAEPGNQFILDNVAAALATLPQYLRTTAAYSEVRGEFDRQFAQLSARLEQVGLRRYGSQWIPAAQMEQIEQRMASARKQLDQLAAAFDASVKRAQQLDQNIFQMQAELSRMQMSVAIQFSPYGLAPVPIPAGAPVPALYANLQQDMQLAQQRRQQEASNMQFLRQQAIALQKQIAPPPMDWVQRMAGPAGTPMQPGRAPATQPATASTWSSGTGGHPLTPGTLATLLP